MMLRQGVGRGSTPPDPLTHLGDRDQQHAIATIFDGSLTRLAELYGPVVAALGQIDVPAFVGWGDRDPFFDLAQGERTAATLGVELRGTEGGALPPARATARRSSRHRGPHRTRLSRVRASTAHALAPRATEAYGGLDAWREASTMLLCGRSLRVANVIEVVNRIAGWDV